jgi:AcrR family transcriptional regulator
MENKKSDRRLVRTRKSLRDALIELILEKHYDDITVQNIIDRADVGRSTFYLHYRDKEDLFRGDLERFLDFFVQHIDFDNLKKARFVPIEHLFQHLIDFHPFYRALVRSSKSDQLFKTGQKHLAKRIENKLNVWLGKEQITPVPVSILANYLANEIFTLLRWWLDNNLPYAPERMDEIFHQLVIPGFRLAVGDK